MSAENFERCLEHVLQFEGGLVDNPHDPGGLTNLGISRRAYPGEDIRGMTRERAAYLYRRDYWNKVSGDDLPDGLDLVAFDAAVNSGVSRGAKWLQESVGAVPDGKVGPKTIAAARAADPEEAVRLATAKRLAFLQGLRTWDHFGRGWTRRVDAVRKTALDMCQKPAGPLPKPYVPPLAEPEPSNPVAILVAAIVAVIGAAVVYLSK